MKKLWKLALAFTACAAALCLTAAAAEVENEKPGPVRVWGTVSAWEGEGIYLKNSDESDPLNEVVIHLGDAPLVDAATGLPLAKDSLKEGDTLYAWAGPAMALSLPPQMSAIAAVGNVPADAAVPEYYQVAKTPLKRADEDKLQVPVLGGEMLTVPMDVEIGPWLTRQIVTLDNLVPGAQILVWKDADGQAEKIIVFGYAYNGYLQIMVASHGDLLACVNGTFNGETPQLRGKKAENGDVMLPIRAVAESIGYDVRWDKELGAVVSQNGELVFSVKPGADVVQTPDGEVALSIPCVIENGVTYLSADDLGYRLNLFIVHRA